MTPTDFAILLFAFLAFLAFAGKRLMTYLHVLQQEDYDHERLQSWIITNKVYDKRLSLILLEYSLLVTIIQVTGIGAEWPLLVTHTPVFAIFILTAYLESDPRKTSKKKLILTDRAKRILFTALGFAGAISLPMIIIPWIWVWILPIQLLPLLIIAANKVLLPHEKAVQDKYWQEAHDKVAELQPKVIGITGSYGKTSVKHILGHILKTQAKTLITPGSVNTPMGITRIIREELEPTHEYLVVEMGAYGPGSIEGLCKLTPPDIGIISAIGHAHYERFKTLETVAKAKYELAEAVIDKPEGKVIVHERTLRFEPSMTMKNTHKDRFVVVGDDPKSNPDSLLDIKTGWQIKSIKQEKDGLKVRLFKNKKTYFLEAPLYGFHHGYNIALAFATALELGIDPEDIEDSIKSLPQIQHRLEVKRQAGGVTLIDDAFNSNPIGFQSALNILEMLGDEGRKILITPGMVEMGASHEDAHYKIGLSAGDVCDVALVVNAARITSFIKGFRAAAPGKTLLEFESFQAAQNWFLDNQMSGDVVLIENDLPDMYERIPRL